MPTKSSTTARGTRRKSPRQLSKIMKKVWAKRRLTGTAPQKPKHKSKNLLRSAAISAGMKKYWRKRRRLGKAPKQQPKVTLTKKQRSEIAKAAARKRLRNARAQKKLAQLAGQAAHEKRRREANTPT